MKNIDVNLVRKLREMTGAGMMQCKIALMNADGDINKAIDELRRIPTAPICGRLSYIIDDCSNCFFDRCQNYYDGTSEKCHNCTEYKCAKTFDEEIARYTNSRKIDSEFIAKDKDGHVYRCNIHDPITDGILYELRIFEKLN